MSSPTSSSTSPTRRHGGRVRILLAVLLAPLLASVLAAGLAVLSASPAQAANHQVKIAKYAYGPGSLSVTQGDTVTWTNLDTVEHDVVVTNGPAYFQSPMLGKGESWSHTFTTAGSYAYICSVHPDMRASVSVDAAPVATSAPTHATHTPEATQGTAPAPAAAETTAAATTATTATAAAPIAQAPAPAAAPAAPTSTLNPLLLVAGASIAVVVFCLLLMASRPVYQAAPEPAPSQPASDASGTSSDETLVQAAVGAEPAGKSADPK